MIRRLRNFLTRPTRKSQPESLDSFYAALRAAAPQELTPDASLEVAPTPAALTREERIRGSLYGLLVGDALGVPYEFDYPHGIPSFDLIEMEPPAGYQRSHSGVRPGTWSDDGAQALALLECLTHNTSLSLDDFGALLLRWFYEGYLTPDNRVFDVGIQTRRALESMRNGVPAHLAGPNSERENGNGALMRVLPVVFFDAHVDGLQDLAMRQALVTHGHIRSGLSCALYALVANELLKGTGLTDALDMTERHLRTRWSHTGHAGELELILKARHSEHTGSGYVVDSLWSAIHCVQTTEDYETAVKRAIQLGDDTDTTACLAGGLAGLLYGERAIPGRWMTALRGKAIVEQLLEAFFRS
jgi:ADP-ribosylglycohydrolase